MRGVWVSILVLAAVAVTSVNTGCGGSEKSLPQHVPENTGQSGTTAVVTAPDKSEPAAVAVVGRAVKAATAGNPARVERAKVNRLRMKGTVMGPSGPVLSRRLVEAVWPDRLAQTDEFGSDSGFGKTLVRLRRPVLWVGRIAEGKALPVEFADGKAPEAAIAAESVGRHWMAVLVPLADSRTVVFDAKKLPLNGRPADVIRAAAPGTPVFTLWFDEQSGLLLQVGFAQIEPGNTKPTDKVFTLRDHRAADGLMVPGRIEYRQSALPLPLEEWVVEEWEFPERIEEGGFDPPK